MTDLMQFLRSRLDEDERRARLMEQHYPSPWEMSDRGWMAHVVANGPVFREVVRLEQWHGQPEGIWLGEVIQHAARHDPGRVLREIDTKRRLLKVHERLPVGEFCSTCDAPSGIPGMPYGCVTLRLLALPYADHHDYCEEWRP
ncbi:DUF6221 family protein [Streptomyces sp. NPDC001634]|uniref:DUF6221 family protein n=1 Tax=Streptomyces sp. NPDC001634 TaxID=3154390 RepID=UPI00331ABAA6